MLGRNVVPILADVFVHTQIVPKLERYEWHVEVRAILAPYLQLVQSLNRYYSTIEINTNDTTN